MQYAFGAGSLFAVPGVDNPTPAQFGAVQQIGVDFNANTVNLFGAYQFPLATARGTVKIDGSGKFAQLNGRLLNDIFFSNSTLATGKTTIADKETHAVAASVTSTHSATWVTDLGVINAATGEPVVRVASAPEVGEYSVSAGVYAFNAGETIDNVLISYTYTEATGETLTINNALMGVAPAFVAVFSQTYDAKQHVLTLNKAVAAKLTLQSALEDFLKPDFSFGAFSDSSNVVGTWAFSEAA